MAAPKIQQESPSPPKSHLFGGVGESWEAAKLLGTNIPQAAPTLSPDTRCGPSSSGSCFRQSLLQRHQEKLLQLLGTRFPSNPQYFSVQMNVLLGKDALFRSSARGEGLLEKKGGK